MRESTNSAAMASTGEQRLTMLPRDPKRAYIYWEYPDLGPSDNTGQMTLYLQDHSGSWTVVERFEIGDRLGGRFVDFEREGAPHRCEISGPSGVVKSSVVVAPRREAGNDSAAFVRVKFSDRGLSTQPTEHDHPVHGTFPAASKTASSSYSSATLADHN